MLRKYPSVAFFNLWFHVVRGISLSPAKDIAVKPIRFAACFVACVACAAVSEAQHCRWEQSCGVPHCYFTPCSGSGMWDCEVSCGCESVCGSSYYECSPCVEYGECAVSEMCTPGETSTAVGSSEQVQQLQIEVDDLKRRVGNLEEQVRSSRGTGGSTSTKLRPPTTQSAHTFRERPLAD